MHFFPRVCRYLALGTDYNRGMDKKIFSDEEIVKRVASIAAKLLRDPESPKCVKKIASTVLSSYTNKKTGEKKKGKDN